MRTIAKLTVLPTVVIALGCGAATDEDIASLEQAYTCPPGYDCGGPFNPPGAPVCHASQVEAESSAATKSTGASVGDGWNLSSNGYLEVPNVKFGTGTSVVRVRARGDAAGGVWPRMTVKVLDAVVGSTVVTSSSYTNYDFQVRPGLADIPVRVEFDNDECCSSGDRNLIVDYVAVTCPESQEDAAPYAFELASTQGWADEAGNVIASVESSTEQASAGYSSLAVRLGGGVGREVVQVSNPPVAPGSTVLFNVWVPANTALASVQPFLQDENWAWYGNWRSAGWLTPGAFNQIPVYVPRTAKRSVRLGVELRTSRASTETIYVDSVTWASDDSARYGFEDGLDGWVDNDPNNMTAFDLNSTALEAFEGRRSLNVTLGAPGKDIVEVSDPGVPAGARVTFRVFVPSKEGIASVQPFVQQGGAGGWAWTGSYVHGSSLIAGAWNTITVQVPTNAKPIYRMGVEFGYASTTPKMVQVDSVTW